MDMLTPVSFKSPKEPTRLKGIVVMTMKENFAGLELRRHDHEYQEYCHRNRVVQSGRTPPASYGLWSWCHGQWFWSGSG